MPSAGIASGSTAAGGFLVDDPQPGGFVVDETQAGGFVVNSGSDDGQEAEEQERVSKMPFSLLPAALQLLDLQPDDEDVLGVFRNAASGWDNKDASASPSELFVDRRDWRAVCTALLEPAAAEDDDDDDDGDNREKDVEMDDATRQADEESSSGSGDEYREPEDLSDLTDFDDENNDSEDDEYQEASARKGKGKQAETRGRRRAAVLSDSEDDAQPKQVNKMIAPRQRTECRRTYALFFPDVADKDLDSQRLMIKDITRAAKLLKEKITAEEVPLAFRILLESL